MFSNFANFVLIVFVSLTSIAGNAFFRLGLKKAGVESLNPLYLLTHLPAIMLQPFMLIGLAIFGAGAVMWFRVLSEEQLSKSYPVFIAFVMLYL